MFDANEKLMALMDEVSVHSSLLRGFVLARAVQIAQSDTSASAIKALELISRLALGDGKPVMAGGAYGDLDERLNAMTDEELQEAMREAEITLDAYGRGAE